jgi:GTP-binding protein Era
VRSGFVTIIGRPNAGKSTLLNSLVGEKLAIVTHKAQTTRSRITGIVNVKRTSKHLAGQLVFVDTPGVHKPEDQLNKRMMQEVYDSLEGCDLILLIVDVTQKFGTGDEFVLEIVKRAKVKTFLLLNKIDLFEKTKLLAVIAAPRLRADHPHLRRKRAGQTGTAHRRGQRAAGGAEVFSRRPDHRPARTLHRRRVDPRTDPYQHRAGGPLRQRRAD